MTRRKGAGVQWMRRPRDIRSLRRTGRLFRGSLVFLWASPVSGDSSESPLVGVVSGRGFGKAVDRNLARRRVRGCIMDLRHLLEPGAAYLVECRPGVHEENYQKLARELGEILAEYNRCQKR